METILKVRIEVKKYFQELWGEIKKALFPPKQEFITLRQGIEQLRSKNKNELTNMLIDLLAQKNRLLPQMANRKDFKTNSKKTLINAILATHIEVNGINK